MSYYFIGGGTQGSPRIPKFLQRRMAHSGYYFGREGELRLIGKSSNVTERNDQRTTQEVTAEEDSSREMEVLRQLSPSDSLAFDTVGIGTKAGEHTPKDSDAGGVLDQGFFQRPLREGESLTLRPAWSGEKAAEWILTYKMNSRPLRLATKEGGASVSRCVNVPDERWLNDGDTIFFTHQRGGEIKFVSIQWTVGTKSWLGFTQKTNAYYYGEGTIRNGVSVYEKGPMLMSERILFDGLPLDSLVRHAKKDFRTQVGTIDQDWWLIFENIALVREERGNLNSRVGLLIADDLFRPPAINLTKRLKDGNTQNLAHNPDQATTIRIPTTTVIAYGFRGWQNFFELNLPEEVFPDEVWGQIMRVNFVRPQVWRLPPEPNKDFIITSTNDYIPLDGYVLDIGNSPHSFYAKARLGENFDDLYVNDGRNVVSDEKVMSGRSGGPRRFGLNEAVSLGDYQQGVLLKLIGSQSRERTNSRLALIFGSPDDTGRASIWLIILNALAFIFLSVSQKHFRPKLFLGWTLIWGMIFTLLVLRLVLIFRISLIPPLDASAEEVRGIFDKGVDYALLSLLAFAVLTALLFLAKHLSRRANWSISRTAWTITLWGLAITIYTVIGAKIGTNQSLGLRINIADHLLLLLGLALLSKPTLESGSKVLKALLVFVLVLVLVLQVFVVKDAGSIIYACSLVFVAALLLGWHKSRGALRNWVVAFIAQHARWLRPPLRRLSHAVPLAVAEGLKSLVRWVIPIAIATSPLAILVLSPWLVQPGAMREVVQPAIPDTAFYRFASFMDAEDAIVTTKSGGEKTDMSKLLDNSRQNWQMLLYASHGALAPAGYGRAPLSKIGMTYGTSVSDCAFAVYVLAEHGKLASLFLLLLYVLLGSACVLSAWYFDDTSRSRNITLVAIGGFFAYNALYMGGANVGLFVFTGQNIPLLGLNSGGDLIQGLALAWVAGWMLLRTTQEGTVSLTWQRRPIVIQWGTGLCVGAILLLMAISFHTGSIGKEERYRQDDNLKPETFARIVRDLPAEGTTPNDRNVPLLLNGDQLERHQGASVMEIEEQYRKQFNDRADKFNVNGGLYYLDRTRRSGGQSTLRVKVNKRFFFARSPFSDPVLWRGEIVAGRQNDPTVYALNARLNVSIQSSGYPGSVDLSDAQSARTTFSVLLREGKDQFCELTRDGEAMNLVPKKGNWAIYVDGQLITDSTVVAPLSIIVIDRRDPRYRRNLIYLGAIRPILAYVRWRNGEPRRMFPEGSFSVAYFLGKAADQIDTAQAELPLEEQRLGPQLALTLDVSLQQTLQQSLLRYASTHANYTPFRENPNRLAITALDAFSGEVLALASWPLLDPSKREYDNLIDQISEPTRSRFEDNANFTRHVVGSTIKPIVFATMATALWPSKDIGRLKFYNHADPYNSNPDSDRPTHPHLRLGGIKMELWDCNSTESESDMRTFIVKSLDYPEGVLSMLGMVNSPQELERVLVRNDTSPDVSYEGRNYSLDLTKSSENSTAFSIQDQLDGRLPFPRGKEAMNNTILYRRLSSLFDFECSAPPEGRLQRACETFFPSFNNSKISFSRNQYIDNVIPTRLDMGGGDFQGIRQGFLSCFLGGEPCGFNNLMMAESAARLATGERIFARLEDSPVGSFSALPDPLGDATWRTRNIIDTLELVGQTGTAHFFTSSDATRLKIPAQYRAIFKTGTMVEGNEGRESETLMFVIGRWANGSFARGETLAGFLYMEKSKVKNPLNQKVADGDMKKFAFAAPLLNKLIDYLESGRRIR
jgi:hypothetical protein